MSLPDTPRPAARRRNGWLIALALICAWGVAVSLFLPRRGADLPPAGPGPVPAGTRADESWAFEDLDGRPVEFGRFRGKAVFLNLWATWCPPCLAELPSIARLAANPRVKDVAFACVSVDEDPEALRRFMAETKLALPVYRATSLPAAFQTEGIPATFLIAPDGTIAASQVGSARWDAPDVVETLERLAKPAASPR